MNDLQEYLEFAKDLAGEAGKIMTHYYELDEKGVQIKQDQTPVTQADKEINSLVIERVKNKYPFHGVLGEEESFNLQSRYLWIVDPLDGTGDFTNRTPGFVFSAALVERGELRVGLVFDPIAGRMLFALKGKGAYENNRKICVSNNLPDRLKVDSWLAGGIENSIWKNPQSAAKANRLLVSNKAVELYDIPVAYAIARVANGDFDAMLSTIKTPWDVAAGCLIAEEAGAKVTDLYGASVARWDKEANGIMVAPPKVHQYLSNHLATALQEEK